MARVHLTPEIMEHLYDLLRVTRPYKSWKLPEADDVVFVVTRNPNDRGAYSFHKGYHRIEMSAVLHGTLFIAMLTMAHEMCHLKDWLHRKSNGLNHGRPFQKLANSACRWQGWDYNDFKR